MFDIPSDDPHRRPDGVDDATVEAVGRVTEALERVERARGRLYDFHQLIGGADAQVGEAADALEAAGYTAEAERLRTDIVGRNVLEGRWTFQVIEEFDRVYYEPLRAAEQAVRALVAGRPHVYEAELKAQRITPGRRHHEWRPD